MSEVFRFKRFEVNQDKCAMKVNTDSILLGAWSDLHNKKKVLDVGTGTGIIALMLAQRSTDLVLSAVEIDFSAYDQAVENISISPFAERITCIHSSIQEYAKTADTKFDLIVSNPPFYSGGTFSLNENKANVRHTIKLSHSDLLFSVKLLLNVNGHFDLILPYIEGLRFVEMANKYDLGASLITEVRPKKDKNIERLLIRLGHKFYGKCHTSELIIQRSDQANDYTDEMVALTRDFYLFM